MTKTPAVAKVVSRNLQELVAKHKPMSQKELAESIGIPTMVLNRAYRGESTPAADALIRIAKYFRISTDELLGLKVLRLK